MGFRKTFFKNTIILGGYSYTSQIISFLSTIILSRLLLPEEYGFIALITVFTGFIRELSDVGLSFIIVRSDYREQFHKAIHYLSFIIGVGLFFLVVLLAYPISLFYDNPELILPTMVMAVNFILRSVTTVPNGILSKKLQFNSLGSIELIGTTIEVIFMIILAYLNFSYWALIFPSILGSVVRIWLYHRKSRIKFRLLKSKYLVVGYRKAKSIIGNLTGFNLLNYWARNTDNLVIGKYYGADSLGIYNRAYRILNLITKIMTGLFGRVLYPSLKDLSDKGGDINKEYLNLLGIISLLNFPFAVLLIFFAEPLVRILWSETWIRVAELLPFIGILTLTQTLNSTTGNIFILLGKEKILFRIGIPTSIIIILAIIAGAFFSIVHVIGFYTIAIVCIDIPIVLYYGFKKTFKYSNRVILNFWIPKLGLSTLLIVSVWTDNRWFSLVLITLYLVHLIVNQMTDIRNSIKFINNRIKLTK